MAVPVFLSKPLGLLLHFYVNENAGIRDYADFRGKRFGMPDYGMTAAVWLRIMLRTLYDIQPSDITWFNGRPASLRHGRLLDIDGDTSTGVKIVNLESTTELNELLQRGEIDAAYGDGVVQVGAGPRVRHFSPAPVLQRLLADFCRASGGATPMNHTVVFKRELLEEDPDFGRRLHEAFRQSKEEAYRRAKRAAGAYLLFPELAFAAQGELFGEDPYPFGLERNRATLNMIAEQQRLDGLTRETADLDRLWLEVSG
jgi:4,5-dihydroxyphthalate decarboxylase